MRRIAALTLAIAGCFEEAPDTKTASTTVTVAMPDESSSSSSANASGESSSSEGEESGSSSTGALGPPYECPEWCADGCDSFGPYEFCRCIANETCHDGLTCQGYVPGSGELGHCRE